MSNFLSAKEFCQAVKDRGINHLMRDTTVYEDGKKYDKVLYAVDGRDLIGYFSPTYGGTILKKSSPNWSMRGRTFKKHKIK